MAGSQPVGGGGPLPATVSNASESTEEQSTVKDSTTSSNPAAETTTKKKKRMLQKQGDPLHTDKSTASSEESSNKAASKLTPQMADSLLEMNPALRGELGTLDKSKAREMLKKMNISDLLTGMSIGGKNQKDMASYKFWQTQPVPRFDEKADDPKPDGPITIIDPEQVAKEPEPLLEGFEWCELDLNKEEELKEVYELLTYHYVEDGNAMFRFKYSKSFFNWALKPPGWLGKWHIGVRATKSRKLVASIFGIPVHIRIRDVDLKATEINFLCIHKKLRSKRLAPLLIKEVTRRCYLAGIYQAIYTAGVVLPKPVGTCRYFHRPLDWLKLYDVGFSPLPPGSTKARMITRNQVASKTSTPGWRQMRSEDIEAVRDLLQRYLSKFQMTQNFSTEEIEHWLLDKSADEHDVRTIWSYVVEAPETGKITDLVSFYCLESSVIRNEGKTDGSETVKAAYLFYYASETAFAEKEKGYKERLKGLIGDALVEAKKAHFDVFNALTLHDNPLFLEDLKFGAGDGQLHYYLYNYRTQPISGGVNKENMPDASEKGRRGIGMVLL
ncbi:Glycylpeptide N-tetradecanoyltransferase [Endocarpon pusillum Z07020]|uniref:Glycylpeptide N-tetradecanoyltransferase n=1 Tax=Endocarpon pusillum (strain Z07020 / HMAS-L-300199) TaxID=1263415 RepID=U1HDE0_ENDPU|nr:Glycylpeptide N-tetradecanoyltransferase [Endocarpon pusillum Z07020]ERF68035.1 Glycylpeptide N-tetradecanoyltransferase [Endocarpon pusillum Z07020]